ncbi:MAG: GNAT family N-acetyltransferase [Devosia sp.]
MHVRPLVESDLLETATLFHETVQQATAADYSKEERNAWSPAPIDPEVWRRRLDGQQGFVAEADGIIVGFMTLGEGGYIDFAFVHHDHIGKGIGKALFAAVENAARQEGEQRLWAMVSRTAKPFFLGLGFSLVRVNTVARNGVSLENFEMARAIG